MRELNGKRVLITGAARGIGLEMALAFAQHGADAVIADRDAEALPEAIEMVELLGARAWGHPVDVTDAESVRRLAAWVGEQVGPIDVLVNNAGIVHGGAFLEVPLERHLATYRVNVDGVVAMTHAFLPGILERDEGHVVNIASASAFVGLPFGSTYASSKWAVLGFSESLRAELKALDREQVGVTAVCPSYIGTGMFDGAKAPGPTQFLEPEFVAEKVVEAVLENRPFVLEPWLVRLTPTLKGVLPRPLWERLGDALGVTSSMVDWQGHTEKS